MVIHATCVYVFVLIASVAVLLSCAQVLFFLMVVLAFVEVALKGLEGHWMIYFFRFIILFSSIIPISMRVNLDMGKTLYSVLVSCLFVLRRHTSLFMSFSITIRAWPSSTALSH